MKPLCITTISDEALRLRKASALGRKLSSALGVPRRCNSIQPVHLSTVHKIPFDYSPQQIALDLQNGDMKMGGTGSLDIVEEEGASSERSSEKNSLSKSPSNDEKSEPPPRK
ncbi:hypothetical protein ANCCAN_07999 [Ancylostoma caninum]|uniref:Uncharacterized protein n=1 Tax=Ancylostoma caninum TaxID=29170 RepID=A0A368GNL1_ANCCA|nr:hypothetical protein ANCCAN_07999 [Ancylostoma caninum]